MERAVFPHLGARSRRVRVGPGRGLDNAVISAGDGRVLILTVDPVSVVPSFGIELSAWLSVHLLASDYTTSGADPEFATFSYNFPAEMPSSSRAEYVRSIGLECKRLGVSIVGGHTGSYPGGAFTVIGSGSMLGMAPDRGFVAPSMVREGDSVLVTKEAAIEATGSLALSFPSHVEAAIGKRAAGRAREIIRRCSTVEDARAARKVGLGAGGVTAMHDCTEGGVLGALEEMAAAAGKRFVVDPAQIPVSPETRKVCGSFGIDPLTSMGEGALLITCNPAKVEDLQGRMSKDGIPVVVLGGVSKGQGLWLKGREGAGLRFKPGYDKYWEAYADGVRRRLS